MIIDPIYQPYRFGNGRILITGQFTYEADSQLVVYPYPLGGLRDEAQMPGYWLANTSAPGTFSGWLHGPHPTLHERLTQPSWELDANTGLWEGSWPTDPLYVMVGDTVCQSEPDPSGIPYSWTQTGTILSVNTGGDPPEAITVTSEGSFVPGKEYAITLVMFEGGIEMGSLTERLRWDLELRDLRTVWRESYTPGWAQQSPNYRAVQDLLARRQEDVYSWCQDVEMQAHPLTATWSLPLWEEQLDMTPSSALPTRARQALVMSRKMPGSQSRTNFMDGLHAIVGTSRVDDIWGDQEIKIYLPDDISLAVRALAERYIEDAKPAGMKVTIGYTGGFILDVSELDVTFL